jgi:hypothetical protein
MRQPGIFDALFNCHALHRIRHLPANER